MSHQLTESDLDEELSRPTQHLAEAAADIHGDVLVLGAGGKMGPTLAAMARRVLPSDQRVIAASRFSNSAVVASLRESDVETISCDLLDRRQIERLPDATNVIFMAGQKFGTGDAPELTWATNALLPAFVAERYASSRIVVFSTGCVYALSSTSSSGSKEEDPLVPPGEYANSCVARERIFAHYAKQYGTRVLIFRLNYAIDLRYGVLMDIAQKVHREQPVSLTMGYVNVIWQRDANARAIQSLTLTSNPPAVLNVTGNEKLSVRDLALRFGAKFGKEVRFEGRESETAWLSDASRSFELFGPCSTSVDEMIEATVNWIRSSGTTLGKPTHFESADGKF